MEAALSAEPDYEPEFEPDFEPETADNDYFLDALGAVAFDDQSHWLVLTP